MQCLEYERLWGAYLDALRNWGEISSAKPLTSHCVWLRRRATVERDLARERARDHQGRCLVCANIPLVNGQPLRRRYGP